MAEDVILDISQVTKEFPGVTALKNVSIQVKRGEIHGLCGENGAGKSTLMKILCGVYPFGTYQGSIKYEGRELKLGSDSIHEAMEQGIAIVYQEMTLVPKLTVGENIFLGKEPRRGPVIDWDKLYADTAAVLKKHKLPISPFDVVGRLGVGHMQMTEIAKALAENAKVLILDEPTSALSEAEVDQLMEILRELKSQGVTCLYISHKLEEFFRITDTVSVLRDGKLVTTASTKELAGGAQDAAGTRRGIEKLVSLMVGREMKERFPKGDRKPGEVILEVKDLHAVDPSNPAHQILKGISFDLRKGEILGIAGLMGSGRTELVTTLFGEYAQVTQGQIVLEGQPVQIGSSREAMRHGISLVTEDRKKTGLVLMQTILNNMSLPNLDRFSRFFYIDQDAELASVLKYWKSLSIKAPHVHVKVDSLSGGNQQKVVISKWLMSEPRILILDDPTRGIDVGAKFEIYKLMNQLAEAGYSIIMISSELEEVLGMSDRVMVMWEGRSNGTLEIAAANQEKIMARATGVEVAAG